MLFSYTLLVCIADLRSLPYFNAAHQPHSWPAISLTCSLPSSNAARQPLTPGFAAHFHPPMLISLLNHSLPSSNAYQPLTPGLQCRLAPQFRPPILFSSLSFLACNVTYPLTPILQCCSPASYSWHAMSHIRSLPSSNAAHQPLIPGMQCRISAHSHPPMLLTSLTPGLQYRLPAHFRLPMLLTSLSFLACNVAYPLTPILQCCSPASLLACNIAYLLTSVLQCCSPASHSWHAMSHIRSLPSSNAAHQPLIPGMQCHISAHSHPPMLLTSLSFLACNVAYPLTPILQC
jgi:hypothetical protein